MYFGHNSGAVILVEVLKWKTCEKIYRNRRLEDTCFVLPEIENHQQTVRKSMLSGDKSQSGLDLLFSTASI